MLRTALLLIVLLRSVAFAEQDPADLVVPLIAENPGKPQKFDAPRFAFSDQDPYVSRAGGTANYEWSKAEKGKTIKAVAADGSAFWISSDIRGGGLCGLNDCPKGDKGKLMHVTALFDKDGKAVAWHIARAVTASEQTKAVAAGVTPSTFDKGIDKGAEDAAKLFETTIGDGKALAASVSDRKDVVLYGSAPTERIVGGAKVKAQLAKWNLVLTPTSGIQAGVVGSVAWVAANVDSQPKKGSKAKPVPYRALFIYESGKLVNAHFSFLTN